ncbi:MAG: tetratricopeptide repeat protein [Candidatus Aureabacteria bacterium]|nr:tetratricopeptide repeat protein [Candidatus Auribacterota bacterium]
MRRVFLCLNICFALIYCERLAPAQGKSGVGPFEGGELRSATAAVPIPLADPFTRGVAYTGRGDIEKSIAEFQKSVQLNPSDPAAHLNLGILYGSVGKLDAAVAEFDRALEINPGSPEIQFNRGIVFMRQGKQRQAISAFEKSIILGGDNIAANYNLAICYEYSNGVRYGAGFDAEKSIYHYRKVLEKRPDAAVVYYNAGIVCMHAGDTALAEKALRMALDRDPSLADAYFQIAVIMLKKQAYQGALRNLIEAQRIDSRLPLAPQLAEAYGGLGKFFLDNGDFDSARKYIEQALEQAPSNAQGLILMGRAYRGLQRYAEAVDYFTRARSLDSRLPLAREIAEAYMLWGDDLAAEGLCERAVTEYENAISTDPALGRSYARLGKLYDLGFEDRGKAAYYYRKALDTGLAPAETEEVRKALADAVREDDSLMEKYRTLVARNPDDATLHYNLGVIYQARGKMDSAIEEYTQALRLDQGNSIAHYNLGLAYEKKRMRSAALREYKLALQYDPRYPRAGYALGRLYEEWGAYKEAREQYERVIEIAPDYADAQLALGLLLKRRFKDAKGAEKHLARYEALKKNAAPAAMP